MNTDRAWQALQSIDVRVELPTGDDVNFMTLNVVPLLHEVRHALERLLAGGEETTIDLGAIPLAPGELEKIDGALGVGEVKVALDALGPSQVYETQFSGAWRINHLNAAGEVVGRYVEVARIPSILLAQDADVRSGIDLLTRKLGGEDD